MRILETERYAYFCAVDVNAKYPASVSTSQVCEERAGLAVPDLKTYDQTISSAWDTKDQPTLTVWS